MIKFNHLHVAKRGFTLVELIIAISIISILTAVATISYRNVSTRGRDAQRKNDLNQVKIVLSSYYNAQTPTSYVISASAATLNNTNDPLFTALVPGYIRAIPIDPQNNAATSEIYTYQSLNSGKNFQMTATLENKLDTKGWGGGSSWVANGFIVQDE
jgi:prepilin-type N-terminal cleavage/methylation domain-containing protein